MKTAYALLRERCGLSLQEAAAFHDTRIDTVTSWSSGRRTAPAGAVDELRQLYVKIEKTAGEALKLLDEQPHDIDVELGMASDDVEAQSLGWPCVGAQAASLGIVAAHARQRIIIVPRGATVATAAAADVHQGARKPAMTVDDVRRRVAEIEAIKWDNESAHSKEDALHQDVLAAIADGKCLDVAGCAAEALQTQNISFRRWYA